MRLKLLISYGALALSVGYPAWAHHSVQMFDLERTAQIAGTIRDFQWANPHVWIQVNVANADGVVEEWSIEGSGPNRLARMGWRPNTFEPGDEVTMIINPMKDGGNAGLFVGAEFSDGSIIGKFNP